MKITAKMVGDLRSRTGAGMMDCKKALTETNGDVDLAIQLLREKGLKASELKTSRQASEGTITSYIHPGSRVGVLVEINCETDFVARTDEFRELAKNIAMQIAASKPTYLDRESVPADVVESEKSILKQQDDIQGKPEQIIEKIVEGRIDKFFAEVCLIEQSYIKDNDKTIAEIVKEAVAKLGENIVVNRFSLFVLGQT